MRIDPDLLTAVFYMYGSEDAAREGRAQGGTGFFVAYGDPQSLYAVTCDHVRLSSPVMRLNTSAGGFEIIKTGRDDWACDYSNDLAVFRLGFPYEHPDVTAVDSERFIVSAEDHRVGPGDDVFIVGRHIGYEGTEQNTPMVFFGNLAMMPALVKPPHHPPIESFLVEMRTRPGFSGSPVLIRGPYGSPVGTMPGDFWRVLGVEWGGTTSYLDVLGPCKKELEGTNKRYVNIGQTIGAVTPAWKLAALLDSPEVRDLRHKAEAEEQEKSDGFEPLSAEPESEFGRFEDLTRKLVNTPKPKPDEPEKA